MRKITKNIIAAFKSRTPATVGNSHTDGKALFLHGNKIAEHRRGKIYISLAGRNTQTTKDRLRALAPVWTIKGKVFLKNSDGVEIEMKNNNKFYQI